MHNERVFCNCCGAELDVFDKNQDFTIQKKVGYGSLYDGDTIQLRLCCDCFDELVQGCMIPPTIAEWGL